MAWVFCTRHAMKRSRNMSMVLALTSGRTSAKASSVAGRTHRGRWKRIACQRGPAHARPWATSGAIAPLLADPRLVHEPDLDILSRLLGPHRVDLRSEVFLTDMRRPFAQCPFAPLGNAFAIEASSRDLKVALRLHRS